MPITGLDLRLERRMADITATEIAARMGLSRATIHTLEKSAVITVERERQYRRALADAIVAAREKVA
jgi:DNA-binding XRE family transcriptional regulator